MVESFFWVGPLCLEEESAAESLWELHVRIKIRIKPGVVKRQGPIKIDSA